MIPSRLSEARALLSQERCTHILISDPVDARAVSGFSSSNVYLIISKRAAILCTDFRYQQAAQSFCKKYPAWRFVEIKQSNFVFLEKLVPARSRLGIQTESLPVDSYVRIQRLLKRVRLINLPGKIPALSVCKTPAEVRVMQSCAHIGEQALRKVLRQLKAGVTEKKIAAMLDDCCRNLGAEKMGFDTIVQFGANSAFPHGVPSDARLKFGDFVLFDFGCNINGLCSDMTRTFIFGKASPKQREIYNIVEQAQAQARARVHAGMTAKQADRLARAVIDGAGYGNYFGHGTGHGVGYRVHEQPRVAATSKEILTKGAVVTIEPGIYVPGIGGVRIEDMVYLTNGKPRVLTSFSRSLIELS